MLAFKNGPNLAFKSYLFHTQSDTAGELENVADLTPCNFAAYPISAITVPSTWNAIINFLGTPCSSRLTSQILL